MLADGEIEAIINTTPNDVHLATTSAAAAAGKHVFLDKPIANSISDGHAITEACRKAGVVLALGYQRRRLGDRFADRQAGRRVDRCEVGMTS
jgi:predicted dehydrogenase